MSNHYTDADVQAAARILRDAAFRCRTDEALMRTVLDAVAPAIAARALRDAADEIEATRSLKGTAATALDAGRAYSVAHLREMASRTHA